MGLRNDAPIATHLLLASLVLCACQASPDARVAEPVVPTVATEGAGPSEVGSGPAEVAAVPSAGHDSTTPPGESTAALLARRLTEDGGIALYDPEHDVVIYADTWTQEGTGVGLRVERRLGATKSTTTLVQVGPEEPTGDERDAALKLVTAALDGVPWRVLERTPWEDADLPLSVPALKLTATFDAPRLRLSSPSGNATISVGPPSSTPHLPHPIDVYASAGVPVVVVKIWFDAGSGYAQGYNHYSEHRVVRLR